MFMGNPPGADVMMGQERMSTCVIQAGVGWDVTGLCWVRSVRVEIVLWHVGDPHQSSARRGGLPELF
jgi:hypothetical protein